jgi:hypothetical protein
MTEPEGPSWLNLTHDDFTGCASLGEMQAGWLPSRRRKGGLQVRALTRLESFKKRPVCTTPWPARQQAAPRAVGPRPAGRHARRAADARHAVV